MYCLFCHILYHDFYIYAVLLLQVNTLLKPKTRMPNLHLSIWTIHDLQNLRLQCVCGFL